MEPLESLISEETSKTSKLKNPDRTTLGANESKVVDEWLSQVHKFTKGYLDLTKSDIVNFLVRQHPTELSVKELQSIRIAHYDPIKHITWITPQIKQALSDGNIERVLELQEELRKVELSVVKNDAQIKRHETRKTSTLIKKRKTKLMPTSEENAEQKNSKAQLENSP